VKKIKNKVRIYNIRHEMYESSKLLGDLKAVEKRKIGKRILRRVVGKGVPGSFEGNN